MSTSRVRRASKAVSASPLKRSASLQQSLSLELRRKQGLFRLEAREVVQGPGGVVVAVLLVVVTLVLLLLACTQLCQP